MNEVEEHRAALDMTSAQISQMRADLKLLCGLLREVRYTQTVGEMQRIVRVRAEVEARWGIKEETFQ